jgi:hypothetical protein
MPRARFVLASLALFLAACQGGTSTIPATGNVTPTVSDGQPATFANYDAARAAFTRGSANGVITATLKDAAWLRMSGDPASVMAKHPDYFDQGYTAFEVVFRVPEFVRPTEETFILTDSEGGRLTEKPVRYKGEMTLVEDRFHYTFDLAFRHGLSKQLTWIRLTREKDGEFVEWRFE